MRKDIEETSCFGKDKEFNDSGDDVTEVELFKDRLYVREDIVVAPINKNKTKNKFEFKLSQASISFHYGNKIN
ncbi:hypothetical protein FRX31_009335 [Thalictrum thalictroides]|uniref:Uncharacterized protein n=1 Tax=Thalictrum thalictroides TaxID=46969 RepID=A0A7J6WWN6_THATH|nr:hypothetical protein FRX31_009335 [Thalictrum thalictroides]